MDNNQSPEERNAQLLQEALDQHQVTDVDGTVNEGNDTYSEEPAPQEETTVDDAATGENPAEEESPAPKAEEESTETTFAEDDAGKRYVPESRFKEVYGKQKALERELEAYRRQQETAPAPMPQIPLPQESFQPLDQTAALEMEVLKTTLPQFDPSAPEYNRDLDEEGSLIYMASMKRDKKGNETPGITRIQAAKMAIERARRFTKDQVAIQAEARQVKAQTADQGITSRVLNRQATEDVPSANASDEELEAYLRRTGQW